MAVSFSCSCGVSFRVDAARLPIFCRCGKVTTSVADFPQSLWSDAHRPLRGRCVHLGGDTDHAVECPTCVGNVRVKVFDCRRHGQCTIAKQLPNMACCANCDDKQTSPQSVHHLAVVTSFFNPHRGHRRAAIYSQFAEGIRRQGLPLFCVEGSFGRQSSQVDSTWQVEIDPDAVLWHKESLLQWAIDRLPDYYDAVVWIDADVVYQIDDLGGRIIDALRSHAIVQPWSEIQYLDRDGQPSSPWRASMAKHNQKRKTPDANPANSFPGMAWATSRELLVKIGGMYTRCVNGGGDVAWAAAAWGDLATFQKRMWSPALIADVMAWGRGVTTLTGGHVGMVDARVNHLYHGELKHRQYVERNAIFGRVDFDPRRHLARDERGMLRWSDEAPVALREAIHRYLHSRREDE